MKFPDDLRATSGRLATPVGAPFGVFHVPPRRACGRELRVLVSDGVETGWEHVSVSVVGQLTKCPSWPEMCVVKSIFWSPEETVMQLHPPESDYVNNHPGCLHLWRPVRATIPLPPPQLVGIKGMTEKDLSGRFDLLKLNV